MIFLMPNSSCRCTACSRISGLQVHVLDPIEHLLGHSHRSGAVARDAAGECQGCPCQMLARAHDHRAPRIVPSGYESERCNGLSTRAKAQRFAPFCDLRHRYLAPSVADSHKRQCQPTARLPWQNGLPCPLQPREIPGLAAPRLLNCNLTTALCRTRTQFWAREPPGSVRKPKGPARGKVPMQGGRHDHTGP